MGRFEKWVEESDWDERMIKDFDKWSLRLAVAAMLAMLFMAGVQLWRI